MKSVVTLLGQQWLTVSLCHSQSFHFGEIIKSNTVNTCYSRKHWKDKFMAQHILKRAARFSKSTWKYSASHHYLEAPPFPRDHMWLSSVYTIIFIFILCVYTPCVLSQARCQVYWIPHGNTSSIWLQLLVMLNTHLLLHCFIPLNTSYLCHHFLLWDLARNNLRWNAFWIQHKMAGFKKLIYWKGLWILNVSGRQQIICM